MRRSFDKLGPQEIRAIAELRRANEFFWIDLAIEDTTFERLREVLAVPENVLAVLRDFNPGRPPARKFHADEDQVAFPFQCIKHPDADVSDGASAMGALEVHVLVHGQYLLTVHQAPFQLQALVGEPPPGRSEQYRVYTTLDAMVATVFEALTPVELALEALENDMTDGRSNLSRRGKTIRGARARLAALRRRIGPQRALFERVSEEIEQVKALEADSRSYFERIDGQLGRAVDGIDAASRSLSSLIDLRLNETMFRLTLIATIFLPIVVVTSFFGMNFGWMVEHIDSLTAFLVFGVGTLLLGGAFAWMLVNREGR
jgi:magnesium transporter